MLQALHNQQQSRTD